MKKKKIHIGISKKYSFCICLFKKRDRYRAVVKAVMKSRVP